MMSQKVVIGGRVVFGRLPLWCLLTAIALVVFIGPIFAIGGISILVDEAQRQKYPISTAVIELVLCLVCLVVAVLLLRGWIGRGSLTVNYCHRCQLPLPINSLKCSKCGDKPLRLSLSQVRRLLEGDATILAKASARGGPTSQTRVKQGELGQSSTPSSFSAGVVSVFISHVEDDADIAAQIAQGLEEKDYSAWYYERDTLPGEAYLTQVGEAIEEAAVVIVIVSPASIKSQQVTNEIVRAYESGKPFIPLLRNITHKEFRERQPLWRQALGASTSIAIAPGGIGSILPRIIAGLERTSGTGPQKR